MGFFSKQTVKTDSHPDFSYLEPNALYFDNACQTLRPKPVIAAIHEYFTEYNSCGGRVKYDWGIKVDAAIDESKSLILSHLKKSPKEYSVAFTLNTTTGLNLILNQLRPEYDQVITTEIEHNSVFLPSIALAKRLGCERLVLKREENGSVLFQKSEIKKAIFIANNVSNIDGRLLSNLKEIVDELHSKHGIAVIDAAQGIWYGKEELCNTDFDALAFSSHKLYGPSLGIIVIKNALLDSLNITHLGGGMVDDVGRDSFTLLSDDHLSTRLELGLQDYAGIVGLHSALQWIKKESSLLDQNELYEEVYTWLKKQPHIHVINETPTPIISFYSDKVDSHKLAIYLSGQKVMTRSGYFCCHYYLKHVRNLPPLLRISFGAHNTKEQVVTLIRILETIFTNIP